MQATATQRRPSVKIHRASPTSSPPHSQSMIAPSPFAGGIWPDMGMGAVGHLSAQPRFQDPRYHKRGSSGSSISIVSNGPDSPLDQANIYQPRIATSDVHYPASPYDIDYPLHTAKIAQSMPDSTMYHSNPMFGGAIDMRRMHSAGQDDRALYAGPQSVSTMSQHNSPATPQAWDDSYAEDQHFGGGQSLSAAYTQSLQDVFPERQIQIPYHQIKQQMKQMPNGRHTLSEQYARSQQQHLRTNSPTSNPRERSPFKPNSSILHQQQMPQSHTPGLHKERTSISPKELMLDDHDVEDNQAPMFPAVPSFSRQSSNFYTAPSFSQETSMQIPQHYPFVSQGSSQNIPVDSTPDFPAHMPTMESTEGEGPSEPSSQQSIYHSQTRHEVVSRPADVSSDAGTYSCTYHGCPQRFDTPAKLQKHKRERHRQHETVVTTVTHSQAGPHRCDRINPSTGKPCNSIFSRPYDLTRHEDTIHNARKMKVRCHLCTEEKTFSRNDALTRHMRVVHPDVDWVGKQKRKSHR